MGLKQLLVSKPSYYEVTRELVWRLKSGGQELLRASVIHLVFVIEYL